VSVIEVAMCVN